MPSKGQLWTILTHKRLHSILWRFSTAGMEGYSSVRLFFGGVSLVKCTLKVLIWYYMNSLGVKKVKICPFEITAQVTSCALNVYSFFSESVITKTNIPWNLKSFNNNWFIFHLPDHNLIPLKLKWFCCWCRWLHAQYEAFNVPLPSPPNCWPGHWVSSAPFSHCGAWEEAGLWRDRGL